MDRPDGPTGAVPDMSHAAARAIVARFERRFPDEAKGVREPAKKSLFDRLREAVKKKGR